MPGTVASSQARESKAGRVISAGGAETVAASASSQPRSRTSRPSAASAGSGCGASFGTRVAVTGGTGLGKLSGFCGGRLRLPRNSAQRLSGVGPAGAGAKRSASSVVVGVCASAAISAAARALAEMVKWAIRPAKQPPSFHAGGGAMSGCMADSLSVAAWLATGLPST